LSFPPFKSIPWAGPGRLVSVVRQNHNLQRLARVKYGVNEIAAAGRADPETEATLARCGHQALLAAGGIGDACLLEQHDIIVVQLFDQQFQSLVLEVVFPRCARIREQVRT